MNQIGIGKQKTCPVMITKQPGGRSSYATISGVLACLADTGEETKAAIRTAEQSNAFMIEILDSIVERP